MQAKKLSSSDYNYASLMYTNKYGLQIDKLIADSRAVNAFPVYVFFGTCIGSDETNCNYNPVKVGAHAISALVAERDFIKPGKAKVSNQAILERAVPLTCFTCCPMIIDAGGSDPFNGNYLDGRLTPAPDGNSEIPQEDSPPSPDATEKMGFHEKLSTYVSTLIKNPKEIPPWWESEFRRDLDGIDAIVG